MSNIEQANNTNSTPAATHSHITINESELFEAFYESDFVESDMLGNVKYEFNIAELLQPELDYCEVDFRIVPGEIEDPTYLFGALENDLLGALANLKLANRAWEDLKSARLIKDDSDEYRYTVITNEEVAA